MEEKVQRILRKKAPQYGLYLQSKGWKKAKYYHYESERDSMVRAYQRIINKSKCEECEA